MALAFGALLAGGPLLAQAAPPRTGRVVGHVVDAASGQPLSGTAVQLVSPDQYAVTGTDGEFRFSEVQPGDRRIQVDRIGYRTVQTQVLVRPGETCDVRLELTFTPLRLSGLVVTGTVHARAREDVLSPTAVVAGAELERRLAASVSATLEDQPGMASTTLGPATARPVIRGLGGDRILVLEDGQRPGDLSGTSSDHAVAIESATAQRFEVVRGPMSLLYGSSALGGVVNVVRDEIPRLVPRGAEGVLSLVGESATSGITAAGSAATGTGPWGFRVEGSFRNAGDVRTPVGSLMNTETQAYGGSAGFANIGSAGHAGASYRFYANDYGIPGGFVGGHEHGVNIEMRRHSLRAEVGRHEPLGPFSTVDANMGYVGYRHDELEASGEVGTHFEQQLLSSDVLAHHERWGPIDHGAIGVRAQYRDIITGGSLRTPSTRDLTLALFAVEEAELGPVKLQAGARYDWANYEPQDTTASIFVGGRRIPIRSRTFGSASGSLGLLWAPVSPLRVGASLSRAYRTPDFNELYSDGPHLAANSYDVGDPELQAETGFGLDAFARITTTRFQAEVAAFRNQLSNYVFPSSRGRAELGSQGGRPRFQYTNEDALFTGAEAELEWSAPAHLVVHGTASYVRARFTSERAPIPVFGVSDTTFIEASRYPPFIPPLHGTVGVRYDRPSHYAGVEVKWSADADRLGDFESPTGEYALLNISLGTRFAWGGRSHSITLGIDNATDAEYRNHLSRTKEIMPEPGRNVSLRYRLAF